MNLFKKLKIWIYIFLVINFGLFIFYFILENYVNNDYFVDLDNQNHYLPIKYTNQNNLTIKTEIYIFKLFGKKVYTKADDCIQTIMINSNKYLSNGGNCWFEQNNIFTIENYKNFGKNDFMAGVQNKGGELGVNYISFHKTEILVFFLLTMFSLVVLIVIEKKIFFVFGLIIVLRLFYLSYTPFNIRSHDVNNHISYINYIKTQDKTYFDLNFQKQHPIPFYYTIGATFLDTTQLLNIKNDNTNLQILMLIINIIGIVYIYLILKHYKLTTNTIILVLLTISMLPSFVYGGVRINDDGLGRTMFFVFFYYMLKFKQKGFLKSNLLLLSLIGLASIITKKTNSIIIPIFLIYSFISVFTDKKSQNFKNITVLYFKNVLIFVLPMILIIIPIFIKLKQLNINIFETVPDSLTLNSGLKLTNNLSRFIDFNLVQNVKFPFTSARNDDFGRQVFFDYVYKTSLFGEFSYDKSLTVLSQIISANYLLIIILSIIYLFYKIKFILKKYYEILIYSLFLLLSLLILVLKAPYACSQDFRYIMGLILSFALMFGLYLDNQTNRIIIYINYVIIIFFIILLNLFFIKLSYF